jgi:hypothetical protein
MIDMIVHCYEKDDHAGVLREKGRIFTRGK